MIYLGVLNRDYRISVDIKSGLIKSDNIIFADTDRNVSNIYVDFLDKDNKVDITNFTFIANIQKPDTLKYPLILNIIDAKNGVAEMILPIDVTMYEGVYSVEIEMKNGEDISHTYSFKYKVRETLCGDIDDSITEDPVHGILIELVDTVKGLEKVVTENEAKRIENEESRKRDESSRCKSELERQSNEKDREKRINNLIAAGTVDLELKDARTDVKGVVHPNLKAAMTANYNYLNTMSDILWETIEG